MKKKILKISLVAIALVVILIVGGIATSYDRLLKILKIGINKEREYLSQNSSSALPLSAEVEALRGRVAAEAEACGIKEYTNLLLAVMMQESGGRMPDVFQASESMGLPPNSIGTDLSIKQGVRVIADRLKTSCVESPEDIPHIRLALQGYNCVKRS